MGVGGSCGGGGGEIWISLGGCWIEGGLIRDGLFVLILFKGYLCVNVSCWFKAIPNIAAIIANFMT